MEKECCNNRVNFGHEECVDIFSTVVGGILAPLRDSNGNDYVWDLDQITFENFNDWFYFQNPSDRLVGLPRFKVFDWVVADTLFEEAPNQEKSYLKDGKTSLNIQFWDKDATPTMKGKISSLRCAEWGILLVTSDNKVIGEKVKLSPLFLATKDVFRAIPLSSGSVDGKFMFKTDAATQKVMFDVDFYREFDAKNLYSISGNHLYDASNEIKVFNFLNLPTIVDSVLSILSSPAPTATSFSLTVNTDYRQGSRGANDDPGNVTDLLVSDFILTNATSGLTVIPSGVVESANGQYDFTIPAQTTGDKLIPKLKIDSTKSINFNGSTELISS